MLKAFSYKLAQQIEYSQGDSKENIYAYGLEILISTTIGFVFILILSALFDGFISGIIFILIFSPLRMFSGGYHARTYRGCFMISIFSFLTLLFLSKATCNTVILLPLIFIFIIACCYIAIKKPIINKNQKISIAKQKRNKIIARIILVIDILVIICLSYINKELLCMAMLAIILVAIFILITNMKLMPKN